MRRSLTISDDSFEPALSVASSSGSLGSYGYYHKQQELIKCIQDTQGLLNTICSDHRNERFPLLYPRYIQDTPRRSRIDGNLKFQLIGLMGARGNDLSCLDEASLGRLLSGRLEECRDYLERLVGRVRDKSSRVLITGDVNGGKSTLTNALLNSSILPMDQQPCTQAFCEVVPELNHSTDDINVHAIPDYIKYDPKSAETYDIMSIGRMQSVVQESDTPYQWYRIHYPHPIASLCNDLVQVSLIDSPGLNSDLFKTMNLFRSQEEIDVVLFVINAANHVTLSAREFLEAAGRDKAYIFIVVNKFDDIKNKEKCKRIILQQISEVLPCTASESSELIHFVSAKQHLLHALSGSGDSGDSIPSQSIQNSGDTKDEHRQSEFTVFQSCLSEFILSKRTKSKLLPAKTYLVNLLNDLQLLFEYNEKQCQQELIKVRREIDVLTPQYEELVKHEAPLKQDLLHGVTDASNHIYQRVTCILNTLEDKIRLQCTSVEWRGVWGMWGWRTRVLDRVQVETQLVLGEAQQVARDNLNISISFLHNTAQSHSSMFTSLTSASTIDFANTLDQSTLDLSTWELIDIRALIGSSLYSLGKSLVAGSLATIAAGYMSVVNGPILHVLLAKIKRPWMIAILAVVTSLSTLSLLTDFEQIARRRLLSKLLQHCTHPSTLHSHAHSIESACHQQLMQVSGSLLSRFQEALGVQRRLRAEKDLQKALHSGHLEFVVGVSRKITILHGQVSNLQLL